MPTNDPDYYKNWYLRNKPRLKKVRRAYYLRNQEKLKAYQAEYRKKQRAQAPATSLTFDGLAEVRESVHSEAKV